MGGEREKKKKNKDSQVTNHRHTSYQQENDTTKRYF
jgi:hypothetical protein